MDKQHLLCHELAGTAPAFFCACNSSALYKPFLQIVVTKNKTDLYIASQINHEGLFKFLASEFLSELYLLLNFCKFNLFSTHMIMHKPIKQAKTH